MSSDSDTFMNSGTGWEVLDPEDTELLLELGLVVIEDRWVKIHRHVKYCVDATQLLQPSSTPIGAVDINDPEITSWDSLPRFVGATMETLVYLGFSQFKANEVVAHTAYVQGQYPEMRADWIDLAIEQATHPSVADIGPHNDDWKPLFEQLGLADELYNTIMDPEFTTIRRTATAKYWIKDTIENRYGQLLMIQECSKRRAGRSSVSSRNTASSSQQTPQISTRQSFVSHARAQGQSSSAPSVETAQHGALVSDDDCLVLWKGIAQHRVEYDDGHIAINQITSAAPTDFVGTNANGPVVYLAKERSIAVKYAQYAKTRMQNHDDQPVAVLRVQIQKDWVDQIQSLIFEDDWKKVVFLSRRKKSLDSAEATALGVSGYRDIELFVGDISTGVDRQYLEMTSWQAITGDCGIKLEDNRTKATQYDFRGREVLRGLKRHSIITFDEDFAQNGY